MQTTLNTDAIATAYDFFPAQHQLYYRDRKAFWCACVCTAGLLL